MSSIQMMVSRLIRTGMIMAVLGALPLEISYFLKEAAQTPDRVCSGAVDRQSIPRQAGTPKAGRVGSHRLHRATGAEDHPIAAVD